MITSPKYSSSGKWDPLLITVAVISSAFRSYEMPSTSASYPHAAWKPRSRVRNKYNFFIFTDNFACICLYLFFLFFLFYSTLYSVYIPLTKGSRNEYMFLLDYLAAKTYAKVHRKTETKCLLGILFIKTSEKANFYGDVINARQGQKCIWSGEEHFCPCRASCFLDIRTQGVALGYVLVALPGRFFNRILVEYFFSREENNFLSGGKTFWVGSNGATSRLKWGNESAQYYFRHMVLHFFRSSRFHPERIPKASRRHPEGLQ